MIKLLNNFILLTLLFFFTQGSAQIKYCFTYDVSGNQESVDLCSSMGRFARMFDRVDEGVIHKNSLFHNLTIEKESLFSANPNPFKDKLNINWTQSLKEIKLFNLESQLILVKKMEGAKIGKAMIDLPLLSTGIYILIGYFSDGTQKSLKVIKQ